jgi:microsomal dipeptidase-like Zn-dependent dipeptidase
VPFADDPDWFPSMRSFPTLAEGLARHGLGDADVRAVTAGNWMRLYDEVLG